MGQRITKTVSGTGGGGGQTLFSDSFLGADGRPIDDQADKLWKGGGKRQIVARVEGGQAEIAPHKHIKTVTDFALGAAGLVLKAKLIRGTVSLINARGEENGVVVQYAGTNLIVVKARDDDSDSAHDDASTKRRFTLANPGVALLLEIDLKPGSARVTINAGAQTLDTGEIALPEVRQGERFRIRLGSIKEKNHALSGKMDDVVLKTGGGGSASSSTIHYGYDMQGRLIGEYTGQGVLIREYAYLNDIPVALFDPNGAVSYIYTDQLNTPRAITNNAGQTVWQWNNVDPFGNNVPNENPSGFGAFTFNLRFLGQYFDKETNLAYNIFRNYDSSTGRYVESDPIGLRGGINTFAYVGGNPVSEIDPDGRGIPLLVLIPLIGGSVNGVIMGLEQYTCSGNIGDALKAAGRGFVSGTVASAVGLAVGLATKNPSLIGASAGLSGNITEQLLAGKSITSLDPIDVSLATVFGTVGGSVADLVVLAGPGRAASLLKNRGLGDFGPRSLEKIGQEAVAGTVSGAATVSTHAAEGKCECHP